MKHRNKRPRTSNAKVLMQRMGYGRMIRQMSALEREPAFRGSRGGWRWNVWRSRS